MSQAIVHEPGEMEPDAGKTGEDSLWTASKIEDAYNLINSLRSVFRNKKLTKEAAKEKLGEWYDKVAACTLREIKSVRDTIKFYEDEILNYFIERQTNASAESLNSKIKCFRAQVKGIRDKPFFMYRLATVLG